MADQVKIEVYPVTDSTSEAAIRDHRIRFDRPLVKGGTDAAPMGGEVFVASVAGCFMSNLLAAARAREADVSSLRISIEANVDGSPARFVGLDLAVDVGNVDREVVEKLVEIASRGCIMVNTLRDKMGFSIRIG